MIQRRRCLNSIFSKLLFYAPLTVNKYPVYTWDNDLTLRVAGLSSIQNGELRMNITAGYNLFFNSKVPVGVNMSFSAWITPTSFASGVLAMHGFNILSSGTPYSGLFFCKHISYNHNSVVTNYGNAFFMLGEIITPLNIKTFITWTIIFPTDGSKNYKIKVYKNGALYGIFMPAYEPHATQWRGVEENQSMFTIGLNVGGNNMQGYISHYSVYEELSDNEVWKLYQNGGIP